jgi:hypothetical protein
VSRFRSSLEIGADGVRVQRLLRRPRRVPLNEVDRFDLEYKETQRYGRISSLVLILRNGDEIMLPRVNKSALALNNEMVAIRADKRLD